MVLDIQTVHHILKNIAVQNVNKLFVYITDLTSTLIRHLQMAPFIWLRLYTVRTAKLYRKEIVSIIKKYSISWNVVVTQPDEYMNEGWNEGR
jgi:hypothetical protein